MELSDIQEKTQRTCIQIGNCYEVRLPWKERSKNADGSYEMFLRRLTSTEAILSKDPELKMKYHTAIQEYFREGYAQKLERPLIEEGWYLPLQPVTSDMKTTKVRIVFDSAAKVNRILLKSLLRRDLVY